MGNGEIPVRLCHLPLHPDVRKRPAQMEPCCGEGETPRALQALSHSSTLHERKLRLEEEFASARHVTVGTDATRETHHTSQ